jgi:hypothetical protein
VPRSIFLFQSKMREGGWWIRYSLVGFKWKIWFLYPVCGANRSEHIFRFVPAGLSLSHLPPSAPRFLLVFLYSPADLCTARFYLALLFFVARVWPSVQSPVGP